MGTQRKNGEKRGNKWKERVRKNKREERDDMGDKQRKWNKIKSREKAHWKQNKGESKRKPLRAEIIMVFLNHPHKLTLLLFFNH